MGLLKAGTELMAENEFTCFWPESSEPAPAPAESCSKQPIERVLLRVLGVLAVRFFSFKMFFCRSNKEPNSWMKMSLFVFRHKIRVHGSAPAESCSKQPIERLSSRPLRLRGLYFSLPPQGCMAP